MTDECKLIAELASRLLAETARENHIMRSVLLYITAAAFVSTAIAVSAQSTATQSTANKQPAQSGGLGGDATHGQYLVEHVAMCVECHSPRDESGRILQGREFMGSELPVNTSGWATRAPRNRGLLGYSDDQAIRLLTEGAIGRHNEQLRPPMPRFRMTRSDAADVIAFLRSLP
jgi:mono/diheme cytochrome c family protein